MYELAMNTYQCINRPQCKSHLPVWAVCHTHMLTLHEIELNMVLFMVMEVKGLDMVFGYN